ncbi:hypothetical protein O6H91_13G077600 [Diphasiastrum complanatum]|uniref:Uncharacterized protein n=1 Tax=Diphasiastrum complanatum TaxID=34168 RepID=A0ACC2BXC5_DIPCM|nr:hypothetical protein O6H91_13G077600 [Diphasiastrum complanatum]
MEVDTLRCLDGGFPRKQATYTPQDEKYELRRQRYKGQQYSHLYYCRLHKFREILTSAVKERWPRFPVCTILALEDGKDCVVIGTLYKQMRLKPSILDEYSKERSHVALAKPENFTCPDDYLILEDESGRIKLVGDNVVPSHYVTGVVVAICGQEGKDGEFNVQGILEPNLPPQHPHPNNTVLDDKYVAFVSGFKIGRNDSNPLQVQLLVDHLTGHLGEEQEQSLSAQIVRLIIAGDSVELQNNLLTGQSVSSKEQAKLIEPIKELDLILTQIAASMPIDIMPGPNDPSNFSLPQQPLHKCLFPGATVYSTFLTGTNPHQFELDGVQFLGTSGQNIDDLDKYSEGGDRLDFMERTLRWRHLAPTAPDTLGCYPFTDRDPFVIESCPHVYFCGNQPSYSSRMIKGPGGQMVLLVCIPRFYDTGSAVLVNLRTLQCHLLAFSTTFC